MRVDFLRLLQRLCAQQEQDADGVDDNGRAVIDPSKWPSSAGGTGFLKVSQQLHSLGFKLGIHVMHGVPAGALTKRTTIKGTNISVSSIATKEVCPWNTAWHRVDMTKPGSQGIHILPLYPSREAVCLSCRCNSPPYTRAEYYDSIYQQYSQWGIDFIKLDCVFGENFEAYTENDIHATHKYAPDTFAWGC